MSETVVFTFGRCNPPTKGHELLIQTVVETARSLQADHVVYLSQTYKAPTNPLEWNFKRRVCESAFRGVYISKDKTIKNPYLALELLKETYSKIIMIAGSDRVEEFRENFMPYAKEWGIEFEVISSGQRIVESADIDGMSSSKLRQYALIGNKESFLEGLPNTLNNNIKELVYRNTRIGMKKS